MKFKSLKVITMSIALVIAIPMNVFATPIGLTNSTESVATDTLDKINGTDYFADETTNVWQDGSIVEEARVTVSRTSEFEVTIPKEVVLDGSTGTADYKVKAKGDIAGDQKITVTPDANFTLSEAGGKSDVTATVTQSNTEYVYTDLQGEGTEYDGNIAATLTAGEWSGKFSFNINFKEKTLSDLNSETIIPNPGGNTGTTPEVGNDTEITIPGQDKNPGTTPETGNDVSKKELNDYTWTEIAVISEAGNTSSTFSIGDEKELQIGSETYHVQILGFNHDDKADGTGKVGITFGLKECMKTTHNINTPGFIGTGYNRGGWEKSEIRTYVNNDVYNNLPSDLQSVIKTVNKISDVGNKDTSTLKTTEDKLFLFSTVEVGYNIPYDVDGQGNKYEYFTDNLSRVKYLDNTATRWWLRSASPNDNNRFFNVCEDGLAGYNPVNYLYGVVFGFAV